MPIYEYTCDACGEIFEEFQSISARPLKKCRHCGSKSVRKLVSNTSFILKGSGWYATDYARKVKSQGPKKEEKKAKESTPAAESKTPPKSTQAGESHAHT